MSCFTLLIERCLFILSSIYVEGVQPGPSRNDVKSTSQESDMDTQERMDLVKFVEESILESKR